MPKASMSLAEQANMTADEWDRFVTDWPKVSDTDVYRQIPNLDDSTQAQLDSAFSRASYALMTVVKDLAEQSEGRDIATGDTDSKAMDMSKLGELVPMLAMLPQGMVDDAIAAAAATPESMLSQTAAVFTKGFYMQLSADTDAMQTRLYLPHRRQNTADGPSSGRVRHQRRFLRQPHGRGHRAGSAAGYFSQK